MKYYRPRRELCSNSLQPNDRRPQISDSQFVTQCIGSILERRSVYRSSPVEIIPQSVLCHFGGWSKQSRISESMLNLLNAHLSEHQLWLFSAGYQVYLLVDKIDANQFPRWLDGLTETEAEQAQAAILATLNHRR